MFHWFLIFFLLLFLAFLAASETAFFSLSPFTVDAYKADKDKRKKLVARLLDSPKELLVTILILNVLAEILVQNTFSDMAGPHGNLFFKVGLPLLCTLFLGEILPKSLALSNNRRLSYKSAYPLFVIFRLLGFLRRIFTSATDYLSRLFFFFLKNEPPLSNEELKHILASSADTGILNREEKDLISSYLNLKEAQVREKMSPKKEIAFFDINQPLTDLEALFKKYSTLPLVNGSLDQVLGLISLKNYFFKKEEIASSADLKNILQKPLYVPEWSSAYNLLLQFKRGNLHVALSVDEYGLVSGLITQEDLLEGLVGQIEDRKEEKLYYQPSKDVIIASGSLELSEFGDIFNRSLQSSEGAVTLGGFLVKKMQEIPSSGTKFSFGGFLFYVLEASPTKIKTVYIRKVAHG